MKTVKRIDLEKLGYAVIRLFEAQDDEHPGKRTVAAREMAFYYEFDELIPSIMADKIDEIVKEI